VSQRLTGFRIHERHVKGGLVGCTAVIAVTLVGSAAAIAAARLQPEAAAAWNGYVRVTETRIARELKSPNGFLALDFARAAGPARNALLAGDLVVEPMSGTALDAPSAHVEHWRGAVFIPGTNVMRVVNELEQGPPPSEDILRSSVVDHGPGWMQVSMRLRRKAVLTVVYDTEHIVTFMRESASRATSTSVATRIVEVADAGTPQEHVVPPGDDRGFLWRLNAYWRYQDVAGGMIAECESITLSRDVPFVVRFVVNPIVERTARESMTRTLVAMRTRFAQ
jgi:hypothetical protein